VAERFSWREATQQFERYLHPIGPLDVPALLRAAR
jgi:hypothetical protein